MSESGEIHYYVSTFLPRLSHFTQAYCIETHRCNVQPVFHKVSCAYERDVPTSGDKCKAKLYPDV